MPRLLILSNVQVEPRSSAAGRRMMQLMRSFLDRDWEITYASTAGLSDIAEDLSRLGIQCAQVKVNDPAFDAWAMNLSPTAVLFDRFMTEEQFGWRIRENIPSAIQVLDTEDLHCLRYSREAALKQKREWRESDLFRDIAYREVASIMRCDVSLMISQVEMALLQRVFEVKAAQLHYLPFLEERPDAEIEKDWSSFEERSSFVSIGNFMHAPNRDAVHYLKNEIWPRIRALLPTAVVYVYGAYIDPKSTSLNDPSIGFHMKGRAEDAGEVIGDARVLLAPLRFGAGLKGKLIDACWTGTPSVTTSIGEEGFGASSWPGSVSDDPDHLAKEAVALYTVKEKWTNAQEFCVPALAAFERTSHELLWWKRFDELMGDVEGHRSGLFLRHVLIHHTLKSNAYMSRWIQEKHRNQT